MRNISGHIRNKWFSITLRIFLKVNIFFLCITCNSKPWMYNPIYCSDGIKKALLGPLEYFRLTSLFKKAKMNSSTRPKATVMVHTVDPPPLLDLSLPSANILSFLINLLLYVPALVHLRPLPSHIHSIDRVSHNWINSGS